MRKHIILAAMATAALFTACSNETEEAAKQSMEVRFCVTNNNLTTRATTSEADGAYTTTFGTDDPIIIYSSGLKEDMNGVTGKVSGSNVTINGDAKYYYKDLTTTATFNAYHPMTATYSEGTVSFTVAANQNENFDNNEFMVATATGKGSEVSPVALSFEHQLALVVLNLSGLDDATEVTMNSVKPTVEYVFGGTLTTKDTETIDITMNKRSDAQTYWAMVPAQTFANGSKLFTIKTATATYTYTVTAASGLTTTKNTIHTITLSKKLNETSLSASISGWNPIDNWGSEDVEEEVPTPEVPQELVAADATTMDAVSLQDGSTTNLVISTSWNITTNDSWYVANNVTTQATATLVDASATDATHGKYVNLTCTTVASWYNTTLLYYIANAPKKKCTLSFSFKTDNVESNDGLWVFLGTRVGTTNNFIPTYTVNDEAGTTTYNASESVGVPTTADSWKDVTYNFDLSKLCAANSNKSVTPTDQTEETVSLWIGIAAKTAGKVYSIDNVKLTTIVE